MKRPLAIGIILLFIGMSIVPSTGTTVEKSLPVSFNGNTLYVGGDGPGNYTRIQDAIDNASDSDTVFVFDDSSPYYENVVVDKTINLVGENKNTTVIDGSGIGSVINITSNGVTVSGFTIQNCRKWYAGILAKSNFNYIFENKFINNNRGVLIIDSTRNWVTNNTFYEIAWIAICLGTSHHNHILKNKIEGCNQGIAIWGGASNIISKNSLNNCDGYGIEILCSRLNKIFLNNINNSKLGIMLEWAIAIDEVTGLACLNIIFGNNIVHNDCGIVIGLACLNIIFENNIVHNDCGIRLELSSFNIIMRNNFIENNDNAYFVYSYRNRWIRNFWDDWNGVGPKWIKGIIAFKIIGWSEWGPIAKEIKGYNFDWFPALKP